MPTKDAIKDKICIQSLLATYPLVPFLKWLDQEHSRETLRVLEQIQEDLAADEQAWREASAFGNVSRELSQIGRWRSYCEQLIAHFRPGGRQKI